MIIRQGAGPHETAVVRAWHNGDSNYEKLQQGLDRSIGLSKRQAGFETGGQYDREVTSTRLIDGLDLDQLARNPRDAQAFLTELADLELAKQALKVLQTSDSDAYWNNSRFRAMLQGTQAPGFFRQSISLGHLIAGRAAELSDTGDGQKQGDPFTTTVKLGRFDR